MRLTGQHVSTLLVLALASAWAARAEDQSDWSAEDSARWDLEQALAMWSRGQFGGMLYYYDGHGPLGRQWREQFEAGGDNPLRPEEWSVGSIDCENDLACDATAIVKFTNEELGGLRRYRMVREPGQFWGLVSEERMKCPEGYRLQYQGICFNIEDEQTNDPDIEIRSAEPIAED